MREGKDLKGGHSMRKEKAESRLPCLVAAALSSLAFLASSNAASLASCTSFRAFHSFRLFNRRSSMGVISTWKRLNSCRSGGGVATKPDMLDCNLGLEVILTQKTKQTAVSPCTRRRRQSRWNHTAAWAGRPPCSCPSWAGEEGEKCLHFYSTMMLMMHIFKGLLPNSNLAWQTEASPTHLDLKALTRTPFTALQQPPGCSSPLSTQWRLIGPVQIPTSSTLCEIELFKMALIREFWPEILVGQVGHSFGVSAFHTAENNTSKPSRS